MSDVTDPLSTLDPAIKRIVEKQPQSRSGYIYCGICSTIISHIDEKIAVQGSHQHSFTNPYELVFDIGCYRSAPGCDISGHSTSADTWFMAHEWRLANCSGCASHLGWYFEPTLNQTTNNTFFGLILERVQP
ncbi:MAG: hypothetical protein KUG75_05805 [Pseudomonadales bacterium]|nr:hypothetical protein [Pseudomonadales bacterium]